MPIRSVWLGLLASVAAITAANTPAAAQQQNRPNIVMLMTDDTGWGDFGDYGGGANLGHPTPNIDRVAQEGAIFTSWYGQASCTAGRASFITGRIPIRSALSVVVVPGDENGLTKSTPTIAEFFQKNGYGTYFSGKWHLGDQPKFYPIEHGFDEMKEFAAYYPGVYTYNDTENFAHPWFPNSTPHIGTNTIRSSICSSGKARPASLRSKSRASTTTICLSLMFGRPTPPSSISSSTPRTPALLHGCEFHEDAQSEHSGQGLHG